MLSIATCVLTKSWTAWQNERRCDHKGRAFAALDNDGWYVVMTRQEQRKKLSTAPGARGGGVGVRVIVVPPSPGVLVGQSRSRTILARAKSQNRKSLQRGHDAVPERATRLRASSYDHFGKVNTPLDI